MEKMNIHQRAIDTFNRRLNPDISQGGGGGSSDAVQYIPQELTEAQKMQARKNQGLYYEEDTFGYLLEETTVVEEAFEYSVIPVVPPIVVGEKYILARDGVECEVTAGSYYGMYVYVGFDPTTEEPPEEGPMACLVVAEALGGTMVCDAEAGTHTYTIKGAMHAVSAIDKKYVQPVIDDYMIVMKPRQELIIAWDGDVSEREKVAWYRDEGWVKIADDFPDDDAWIGLSVFRYGGLDEDGIWHNQYTYTGSDMERVYGCYVLGEWNLVFVSEESFTVPGTEYTLTRGIWTYCRTLSDGLKSFYEVEFPEIDAPIMRFAGAGGRGEDSFVCGDAKASLTTGDGSVNGGRDCEVSGVNATAFGSDNTVTGDNSFAVGQGNRANAYCTTVEGYRNTAKGQYSHAEGYWNTAQFNCQHVQGQYNELYDLENVPQWDSSTTYNPGDIIQHSGYAPSNALHLCIKECTNVTPNASNRAEYWINEYVPLVHVVGWGTYGYPVRTKNIHTIDSVGNAMFTGDVTAKSMIIQSSTPDSTKKFKITVDDTGAITATEVT